MQLDGSSNSETYSNEKKKLLWRLLLCVTGGGYRTYHWNWRNSHQTNYSISHVCLVTHCYLVVVILALTLLEIFYVLRNIVTLVFTIVLCTCVNTFLQFMCTRILISFNKKKVEKTSSPAEKCRLLVCTAVRPI